MIDNVYDRTPERKAKIREQVTDYINYFKGYPVVGWDYEHSYTEMYMCDHFGECFDGYYVQRSWGWEQSKFLRDIACVVKAGLDIATPESTTGGVLGFTVGDLRKMFPEGIPDYVANYFDNPLTPDIDDAIGVWL